MRILTGSIAFGALIALTGCSALLPLAEAPTVSYFAVAYKLRAETDPPAPAEVKASEKFPALRPTWKTAALRAPNYCTDRQGGEGSTDASAVKARVALIQYCVRTLAEIERVLVDNKFTVVNWSTLHDYERTKQLPSYQAAKALGAQVVFIVNDLRPGEDKLGNTRKETVEVYETDRDGNAVGKMALDADTFQAVRAKCKHEMRDLTKQWDTAINQLTALLDITAVDAENGEAVWFYLKKEIEPLVTREDRYFLYGMSNGHYWPVRPHGIAAAERDEARKARSTGVFVDTDTKWSKIEVPPDLDAKHQALARKVVVDFSNRIREGG